jgi:DNA invertase Pin-like site-specific DNA recombinase
MIYGYARVSTEAQDYDAQVAALTVAGAEEIVAEKSLAPEATSRCVP